MTKTLLLVRINTRALSVHVRLPCYMYLGILMRRRTCTRSTYTVAIVRRRDGPTLNVCVSEIPTQPPSRCMAAHGVYDASVDGLLSSMTSTSHSSRCTVFNYLLLDPRSRLRRLYRHRRYRRRCLPRRHLQRPDQFNQRVILCTMCDICHGD